MQQCGKHQAKRTSASSRLTGWQNIFTYRQTSNCHLSFVISQILLLMNTVRMPLGVSVVDGWLLLCLVT